MDHEKTDLFMTRIGVLQRIAKRPYDPIVRRALDGLGGRSNPNRHENHDRFFDRQVETLRDRGCPLPIVSMLQLRKGSVIQRASMMALSDGCIPFVPVITDSLVDFDHLMFMVCSGEKVGFNFLDPNAICNLVESPTGLYHIYDVEDGTATRKKTLLDVETVFEQQFRSGLTVEEVIALAIHSDVLSRHNIYASNSRCDGTDAGPGAIPAVFLDPVDSWPGLYGGRADSQADWWGFPSCRER